MAASEEEEQEQHASHFTSQVLGLQHLWDLYLEPPSFLKGNLDPMSRCPQTPWETFSVTNCRLTDSDLTYLSQCPNLSQRKDLDLRGLGLINFSPEPLPALLEEVAATSGLNCGLVDSQAETVMPPAQGLQHLWKPPLSHRGEATRPHSQVCDLGWSCIPHPQGCSSEGALEMGRLALIQAEMMGLLREAQDQLSTSPCRTVTTSYFMAWSPCDNTA